MFKAFLIVHMLLVCGRGAGICSISNSWSIHKARLLAVPSESIDHIRILSIGLELACNGG